MINVSLFIQNFFFISDLRENIHHIYISYINVHYHKSTKYLCVVKINHSHAHNVYWINVKRFYTCKLHFWAHVPLKLFQNYIRLHASILSTITRKWSKSSEKEGKCQFVSLCVRVEKNERPKPGIQIRDRSRKSKKTGLSQGNTKNKDKTAHKTKKVHKEGHHGPIKTRVRTLDFWMLFSKSGAPQRGGVPKNPIILNICEW